MKYSFFTWFILAALSISHINTTKLKVPKNFVTKKLWLSIWVKCIAIFFLNELCTYLNSQCYYEHNVEFSASIIKWHSQNNTIISICYISLIWCSYPYSEISQAYTNIDYKHILFCREMLINVWDVAVAVRASWRTIHSTPEWIGTRYTNNDIPLLSFLLAERLTPRTHLILGLSMRRILKVL